MNPSALPLRDVQLPPAPSWWPPAPGWWLLALALLLLLLALAARWGWHRWRRRRWYRLFDRELAAAHDDAQTLAVLSALLRRAARRLDRGADRLQGEAWLRLLDGRRGRDFSAGPGRLLLEGMFQRTPQGQALPTLIALARARFVGLMAGRR